MTAAVIGVTNGAGELAAFAEDGVDECGFAYAGGAEKSAGAAIANDLAEFGDAVAAKGAGEKGANAETGGFGFGEKRFGVFAGVCLVEDEEGTSAAFPS